METKICSKCKQELPLDNFRWKNKSQGKKHSQCKSCQSISDKRHYLESRERREAVRERADIQKENNLDYIEYKKQEGCAKCGEKRTYVLDFHHIDPEDKIDTVCHMSKSTSINTLEKEINKCKLFCANCHREYHYLKNMNEDLTVEQYINGEF